MEMANHSKSVTEALDRIRKVLESQTAGGSTQSAVQTLDSYRAALELSGVASVIEFPRIANGRVEHVLAFTSDEQIVLKDFPDNPYFSSHGFLVDFDHNPFQGMSSQLSFPIKGLDINTVFQWPVEQPAPFDRPPLDNTNVTENGYSKQAYFFGDGSSLVTVGPSLPKITLLKGGGAQFWVGSNGVITQGTGKYEGARGVSSYNGGAFFETWPESFDKQIELLQKGFNAFVSAIFKLVFKSDRAD
jgi:hypothetical protein